jgi:GWxTD domain-containing protein
MKKVFIILLFTGFQAFGQALQNINYNYQYNPDARFTFHIRQFWHASDSSRIVYDFLLTDTTQKISDYTIRWEQFESVLQKEGREFAPKGLNYNFKYQQQGSFVVANSYSIVAARVTSISQKQAWYFFKVITANNSSSGYLLSAEKILGNYAIANQTFTSFPPFERATVFYYDEDFPGASPPFTESQTPVRSSFKPDSVFQVSSTFQLNKKGLYLIQTDTASSKGFAIRIETDYPKFTKLESLVDPVMYITTKAELDRLRSAQGDKKAFDKVILSIVGNTERAKIFMRNYFRRVESANRFFTSYKEGWKTDRGMLYIIFGQPSFVYKFSDRELWEYKTVDGKITFTFVHSPTLFDPDNYVLIRKRNYRDSWLQAVDLNRNARF